MRTDKELDKEAYARMKGTETFVDMSSLFIRIGHSYENIYGPLYSGKSTLLSALRCYFDDSVDGRDVFAGCSYEKRDPDHREMNRHPVLFLDFSDYSATTWEGGMSFFRMKMSALYISKLDHCEEELWHYTNYEHYAQQRNNANIC